MITLAFGDVRNKRITTPNHFVSHMIEHIAWRMGLSIDLGTDSSDWYTLGRDLGSAIEALGWKAPEGAALGMIDDGCSTVAVTHGVPSLALHAAGGVDLSQFRRARCEQLDSGEPLIALLDGLTHGLFATIEITVWSFEDTHHTWEGIFRGVGIALSRCFTPVTAAYESTHSTDKSESLRSFDSRELRIVTRSAFQACVQRGTAESGVTVSVDFSKPLRDKNFDYRVPMVTCRCDVDPSIHYGVEGIERLFELLAQQLGARLEINFIATKLSSSHVVMEDIGLVVGRALLEILKVRMEQYGVNGAGSTIKISSDTTSSAVNVGVSVEGRKFWRFIPHGGDYAALRREFLLGKNCLGNLRSEDLDDFIDGLAGGMSASIAVLINTTNDPDLLWRGVFASLGTALYEVFQPNIFRQGVPPGVKATLS